LGEVLNLVQCFAWVQPANYNEAKTNTLWDMMGVEPAARMTAPLMCCSCDTYMHYIICAHVTYYHMHTGQMNRPAQFTQIHKVQHSTNKKLPQKSSVPAQLRRIPRGAASAEQG